MRNIAWLKIGTITHYFDKIGVGVVKLDSGSLTAGTTVKIQDGEHEFTQPVTSLQIEHNQVSSIQKGDDAGLKLKEAVKPGSIVLIQTT